MQTEPYPAMFNRHSARTQILDKVRHDHPLKLNIPRVKVFCKTFDKYSLHRI